MSTRSWRGGSIVAERHNGKMIKSMVMNVYTVFLYLTTKTFSLTLCYIGRTYLNQRYRNYEKHTASQVTMVLKLYKHKMKYIIKYSTIIIKKIIVAYSRPINIEDCLVQSKLIETETANVQKEIRNIVSKNNTSSQVAQRASHN